MFRIEMLPAAHGDCLWLEYGTGESAHRILIDGGPSHCYPALRERILHLAPGNRRFDLLVVTHIDADHIDIIGTDTPGETQILSRSFGFGGSGTGNATWKKWALLIALDSSSSGGCASSLMQGWNGLI